MRFVPLVSFAFLSREGAARTVHLTTYLLFGRLELAPSTPKTLQFCSIVVILLPCVSSFFHRASHTVYPPPHSLFSALNLTPLSRVKGEWERGDSGRRSGEDGSLR